MISILAMPYWYNLFCKEISRDISAGPEDDDDSESFLSEKLEKI